LRKNDLIEPALAWDWAALHARCLREARRVLGGLEDAEEAAQEAALRVWRTRSRCLQPEAPEAWVAAIARNEALRIAGRRPRVVALAPRGDDLAFVDVDAVLRLDLARALRGLSDHERVVLLLRYGEDLTERAVAARLGVAEGTVKIRLHRARRSLRLALGEEALV